MALQVCNQAKTISSLTLTQHSWLSLWVCSRSVIFFHDASVYLSHRIMYHDIMIDHVYMGWTSIAIVSVSLSDICYSYLRNCFKFYMLVFCVHFWQSLKMCFLFDVLHIFKMLSSFMVALSNRADHIYLWPPCVADADIIFLPCGFFLLLFYSSPNLSGRRLDVFHTSTHDVALVRI